MCCVALAGGLLSWLPRRRGLCVHRPCMLPGPAGGHLWGRQAVHTVQVPTLPTSARPGMLTLADHTSRCPRNRLPCACILSHSQDPHARHTVLISPGVLSQRQGGMCYQCAWPTEGFHRQPRLPPQSLPQGSLRRPECHDSCPVAGAPCSAKQPWKLPGWCPAAAPHMATTTSSSSPTTGTPPSCPSTCRSRLCRPSLPHLQPAHCSASTACRLELADGALLYSQAASPPHMTTQVSAPVRDTP